jgi:hypothetical protein
MKRLVICLVIGFAVLVGSAHASGMWGIDVGRATAGNYNLDIPVYINGWTPIPVLEDNYYLKFMPIMESQNENLCNLGFQMSRYDLVLGTQWKACDGTFGLEAGMSYYASDNREGYNETMQSIVGFKYMRAY